MARDLNRSRRTSEAKSIPVQHTRILRNLVGLCGGLARMARPRTSGRLEREWNPRNVSCHRAEDQLEDADSQRLQWPGRCWQAGFLSRISLASKATAAWSELSVSRSAPERFFGRESGKPTTSVSWRRMRPDPERLQPSIRIASMCSAPKESCCVSSVKTGSVLWEKDYQKDYQTEVPVWGMTAAPLVEGDLLICLVGGQSNAKVVAFDKRTGKEVWRALSSDSEPGYSPPFALTAGGRRQIIIWHPQAVSALEPATGKLLWEVPFKVDTALSVATPVLSGRHLLVSSFYNGSMLLKLDEQKPQADLVLEGQEQERDRHGRPACSDFDACDCRRICLWHLQLRPVSLSGSSHRQPCLGDVWKSPRKRLAGPLVFSSRTATVSSSTTIAAS